MMRCTGIEVRGQMYRPARGICKDCDLQEECQRHIFSPVCSRILKSGYIWKYEDLMKIPAEALLKLTQKERDDLMKQVRILQEEKEKLSFKLDLLSQDEENSIEREAKLLASAQRKNDQVFQENMKRIKTLEGKHLADTKLISELRSTVKRLTTEIFNLKRKYED